MSDQTLKLIITGALAVHGFGHGGAVGALAWIAARPGTDTGAWRAAQSWLLPGLSAETATVVASAFWIASLLGFVAAALGMDVAVLVALVGMRWPPETMLGR